jgi:hypothetical protein
MENIPAGSNRATLDFDIASPFTISICDRVDALDDSEKADSMLYRSYVSAGMHRRSSCALLGSSTRIQNPVISTHLSINANVLSSKTIITSS